MAKWVRIDCCFVLVVVVAVTVFAVDVVVVVVTLFPHSHCVGSCRFFCIGLFRFLAKSWICPWHRHNDTPHTHTDTQHICTPTHPWRIHREWRRAWKTFFINMNFLSDISFVLSFYFLRQHFWNFLAVFIILIIVSYFARRFKLSNVLFRVASHLLSPSLSLSCSFCDDVVSVFSSSTRQLSNF